MLKSLFRKIFNRFFQFIAMNIPGGTTFRPLLHRMRGVNIGKGCFIGFQTILETESPEKISIGSDVAISVRVTIIAHYRKGLGVRGFNEKKHSVIIEKEVFIGPGVIILPYVTIGEGSVVTAGSVVTTSVPKHTVVQGNPARPIAKCGVPLYPDSKYSYKDYLRNLKPY